MYIKHCPELKLRPFLWAVEPNGPKESSEILGLQLSHCCIYVQLFLTAITPHDQSFCHSVKKKNALSNCIKEELYSQLTTCFRGLEYIFVAFNIH